MIQVTDWVSMPLLGWCESVAAHIEEDPERTAKVVKKTFEYRSNNKYANRHKMCAVFANKPKDWRDFRKESY